MNTTLIELPSVGCVVDVTTKMCYAQKQDNNPDLETGVPLEECDTDWFAKLSAHDDAIVYALMYIKW